MVLDGFRRNGHPATAKAPLCTEHVLSVAVGTHATVGRRLAERLEGRILVERVARFSDVLSRDDVARPDWTGAKHDVGVALEQRNLIAKHLSAVEFDANVCSPFLEVVGDDASVGYAVARHEHMGS